MFRDWLTKHYPDRADHVMTLVQQSRGGRDYQTGFGKRMVGVGVCAKMINDRFRIASQGLGFNENERFDLDTSQFRDVNDRQMGLF